MLPIIFVLVFFTSSLNAFYEGNQVFRIQPNNGKELKSLRDLIDREDEKIDVWKDVGQAGENVDIHIKSSDVGRLKESLNSMGILYSVMIEDVQKLYQKERNLLKDNKLYASHFNYEKYNTFSSIKFELGNLARRHRGRCKLFNLGKTALGQKMTGIKITNGETGTNKPIIWVDGGIHAREWISVAFVMHFIRELLTSNSLLVDRALKKYDFHILPVFNIDGYKYTFSGVKDARFWRKTRSSFGICKGADPNRNWDYKWGYVGTSRTACNENYRGTNAFSEVEVRNVKNYLEGIKDRLKGFWNVHSYSQMVLTPWAYKEEPPKDFDEIERVANIFVNEMKDLPDHTLYRAGPPSKLISSVGGSAIDWVYGRLGVKYSYALELRDTGEFGFLLPEDQIKPVGYETTHALLSAVNSMK